MAYRLEQLGADIRGALKVDPGPAGKREGVNLDHVKRTNIKAV